MPNADVAATLPVRFIALSREAFDGHHYGAAYHALAAAMHSAADLDDGGLLAEVEALAHEQIDWIDTHDPGHRLASASSLARGTDALWNTLAHESRIKREALELRRQRN